MEKIKCAIIGSGNIGTDLMIKLMRNAEYVELAAVVGADPHSDGLARAARFGFEITADSIEGLLKLPSFKDIKIVFDATSAGAHAHHNAVLQQYGIQVIDLTPAAIGPYVVPVVNLDQHLNAQNINMVTCGGQAHSNGTCSLASGAGTLCGNYCVNCEQIRRTWYACQY